MGYDDSKATIFSVIRKQVRVTPIHMRSGGLSTVPDYSWNWDNVHFVQMNVFPGTADGGLAWLKDDLERNVGKSGNPVVLSHHYGFDTFLREPRWWMDQDRENYWNVIKGYNVIAFITGHLHTPDPLRWKQHWAGDPYLKGERIPYFVAGAAFQQGYQRGLFFRNHHY